MPYRIRRLPAAVAAALLGAVSSASVVRAEPRETTVPDDAPARFVEGQKLYDDGDFVGAAETWTSLLEQFPESEENRTIREALIVDVVRARRAAHRDSGDIEQLRRGKRALGHYHDNFRAAYGDRVEVSPVVQEEADALEAALEGVVGPCLVQLPPCLDPGPCLEIAEPTARGCGKKSDPATAMLALLPLALRRRRRDAIAQVADRLPPDVVARLPTDLDDEG